jgi:peptide/nickel transport system substrate-binding protein
MSHQWFSIVFKRFTSTSKNLLFLLVTMLLALVPANIQQPSAVAADHSRFGGTLVCGTINPPTLINPVLTSHSVSSSLKDLIFNSLFRLNEQGNMMTDLVRSWETSAGGLEYVFHLHPNVMFHDGVECTAHDVKFTYDAITDPASESPWRTDMALVSRWEVLDRYTLKAVLREPLPNFLNKLIHGILPRHLYEDTVLKTNAHNYAPIGSGPFRLASWDRATNEIHLRANTGYFEGRPYLDKIVIKVYEDNAALWAGLMRGEVDFVKFLNRADYEVLSKDPAFTTYEIPSGIYFAVIYNIHDPILYDRNLRYAINYAIDRKGLMQAAGMTGIESNGPFDPKSPWFNADVEVPSYNPVRSRLILASRGWSRAGSGGILKKAGQPLVLTMLVDRNRKYYSQMARVLRQQLSEVGIGLNIVLYNDEDELTSEYMAKVKPHMWLRMFPGGTDPSNVLRSWYSSTTEFARLWKHEDKNFDKLFERGRTLAEGEERTKVYRQAHALLYADQPACFLFFLTTFHAVNSRVQNTGAYFSPRMPDYLIKSWFIKQERR